LAVFSVHGESYPSSETANTLSLGWSSNVPRTLRRGLTRGGIEAAQEHESASRPPSDFDGLYDKTIK
jgi:hypothetical protein